MTQKITRFRLLDETYEAVLSEYDTTGCFVCRRILASMDRERRLRDYPVPKDPKREGGTVELPVAGQVRHIEHVLGIGEPKTSNQESNRRTQQEEKKS